MLDSPFSILAAYYNVINRLIFLPALRREIFGPVRWAIVSWFGLMVLVVYVREPLLDTIWSGTGWIGTTLSFLVVPLLATVGAVICTLIRIQFALDRIVSITRECGGVASRDESLVHSGRRILVESVVRAFGAALVFGVTLMSLMIPGVNVLVVFLSALYLGFDILSSCMSSLALPLRRQVSLVSANVLSIALLGLGTTLLLSIPFLGIVLLPVSYAVGAELVVEYLKTESRYSGST